MAEPTPTCLEQILRLITGAALVVSALIVLF